jgi:prepilin-type N-terminal cleavage/methylation domain-containing protein
LFTRGKQAFTLAEVSVVVAIVGIIAAIAMMRLSDLSRSSEVALAKQFQNQLQSGAGIYAARMGQLPTRFTDFVTANDANLALPPTRRQFFTVSVARLGKTAQGAPPCQISRQTISCNNSGRSGEGFSNIRVNYTLQEVVTSDMGRASGVDQTGITATIRDRRGRRID